MSVVGTNRKPVCTRYFLLVINNIPYLFKLNRRLLFKLWMKTGHLAFLAPLGGGLVAGF